MRGPKDLAEASRALESTLVKQLLESSGAFKGTGAAGSQLHAQMFMEVLADAVSKDGGFGLGKMLEKSLAPKGQGEPQSAHHEGLNMLKKSGESAGIEKEAATPHPGALPAGRGEGDVHGHDHGVRTTSGFGARIHPIDGVQSFHRGVDLAAQEGTPILAARDGVVTSAGPRGGYGNTVVVDHGDGLVTLYAHARAVDVAPGDVVRAGAQLGEVGQTGKTTGPHLHFEVRAGGRAIDPKKALNAYGIRAEATVEESPKQALQLP